MKACNFASLDPHHQKRGVSALGNVSKADRELWGRFVADPEAVAAEAETVAMESDMRSVDAELPGDGPTEVERTIRARRVQSFFRATVLTSYNCRCALTGLAVRELLNASHIIPWSDDVARRADPHNGICLNALHDRAFDRGLITFDEDCRLVLSPAIKHDDMTDFHRLSLHAMEGTPLHIPERFIPAAEALAYHREHIFDPAA